MPSSQQPVVLVKTDGVLGPMPVGSSYTKAFAFDFPRDVAVRRTFRMLKRDHPDENPMCWTVSDPSASTGSRKDENG